MDNGTKEVGAGTEVVNTAGDLLKEIVAYVEEVSSQERKFTQKYNTWRII